MSSTREADPDLQDRLSGALARLQSAAGDSPAFRDTRADLEHKAEVILTELEIADTRDAAYRALDQARTCIRELDELGQKLERQRGDD